MPPEPPKPSKVTGGVYQKVSSADPARSAAAKNMYAPPNGGKFDFILNAKQNKASPFSFLSGVSKKILIPVLVVVALFLLIAVQSVFSGRGKAWVSSANNVMARQVEIQRVSTLAKPFLRDQKTTNLNATVLATMSSDQKQLSLYLKSLKIKVNSKALVVYKDSKTDTALKAAAQSNQADSYYAQYLNQNLVTYRTQLKTLYSQVGSRGKTLLSGYYDGSGLIQEQTVSYLPD